MSWKRQVVGLEMSSAENIALGDERYRRRKKKDDKLEKIIYIIIKINK